MKTQKKQLPNEFAFVCDEHSREQLEKLGVELGGFDISDIGFYYFVKNSKVRCNNLDQIAGCPLIYLSDYIDQEQPELIGTIPASKSVITSVLSGFNGSMEIKTDGNRIPIEQKWQEKTRGGYEYRIYEEFEERIYGRVKHNEKWHGLTWDLDGKYFKFSNDRWDLLPINNELTTLQKELEELRVKEKELLEKIEELKK